MKGIHHSYLHTSVSGCYTLSSERLGKNENANKRKIKELSRMNLMDLTFNLNIYKLLVINRPMKGQM